MASSSLTLFCAPEELVAWLKLLAEHFQLGILVFTLQIDHGIVVRPDDLTSLAENSFRVFLYPKGSKNFEGMQLNDVQSRAWGWVDVRLGSIIKKDGQYVLTMTQINAEDFDAESIHPSRFIKWLKHKIKDQVTFGVVGHNLVTGGSSRYKAIGFTQKAKVLADAGTTWKQSITNRSEFLPEEDGRVGEWGHKR